ncbi:MAG: hypothetical protein GY795_45640 [Desulfobacterales bacterium]|nr:hypothetical protein [Desulfobacterales bacterium]
MKPSRLNKNLSCIATFLFFFLLVSVISQSMSYAYTVLSKLPPPPKGDINGDGTVDLADAITGLQVLSNSLTATVSPDYLQSGMDVNNDNKAGLEEVVNALVKTAFPEANDEDKLPDMNVVSATTGSEITIDGSGFDANKTYNVTIGGIAAGINKVTENSITVTVPGNAISGNVNISDGESQNNLAYPLEIYRTVQGTLDLPLGMSVTGYEIGSGADFTIPSESGSFSVVVPKDFTGVVWAFREENDPVFISVITPGTNTVLINPTSTAKALVFLSPLFGTRNPQTTTAIMENMAEMSEITTLSNLISTISNDGGDYLTDARVTDAIKTALETLLTSTETRSASFHRRNNIQKDTVHKEINPDYSTSIPATNVRLNHSLNDVTPNNPRDYILEIGTIENKSNPLDWAIEIWELTPDQFESGFTSIENADHNSTFIFSGDSPVASGCVHASLDSASLDFVEVLATHITEKLFAESSAYFQPNQFLLPKDTPAVYVSQSYSGNLWYGTNFFFTAGPGGKSQTNILAAQDKHGMWSVALSANIFISVIDTASIWLDLKNYISREALADIMNTVLVDVSKNVMIMRNSEDGLNVDEVYDLFKTTAIALMKEIVAKGTEGGLLATVGRFTQGTAKTLWDLIDITGSVSAAEQALERSAGLTLPNALAIERSVTVIGDPFNPVIDGIFPNKGQDGESVTITGRNFGFPDSQNTETPNHDIEVSFVQHSQTSSNPDNQTFDSKLVATVTRRTNTQIIIDIPDNFDSVLNSSAPVYIGITKNNKNASSSHLGVKGEFDLADPPEITTLSPNVIIDGGYFKITGSHFGDKIENIKGLIDGAIELKPVKVSDNYMVLPLPSSNAGLYDGEHTLTLKRGSRVSQGITFTFGYPAYIPVEGTIPGGWSIGVSKLDFSNISDAEISLLEAMHLANGSLGRPIEVHDACEEIEEGEPGYCGGFKSREVDHIWNFYDNDGNPNPGGVNYSDYIGVSNAFEGSTLNIGGSGLPPVGNGNSINFNNITLNGSGASSNPAIFLDNAVTKTSVKNVILENWPGDGIRIANESVENKITNITIRNAGENGISIYNLSSGNIFNNITIDTTGGHGIFIEGDSDNNNFYYFEISETTGSGIHIDGASYNFFRVEEQDIVNEQGIPDYTPIISNAGGHGIHLSDGAFRNQFFYFFINDVHGSGIFLENDAQENSFKQMVVTAPKTHGLHLSGSLVQHNKFTTLTGGIKISEAHAAWDLGDIYNEAAGYGILIENGANTNLIGPRRIFENKTGGILIRGASTRDNFIGKQYRSIPFNEFDLLPSLVFDNIGHGIHISNGANQNTIQLINVSGNSGDGVFIEGEGTDSNHVSGIWTGFQYFVRGTGAEPYAKPNTGNGLHIANGAKYNLIGGFSISRNNFTNNELNGVLIEGEETSDNFIRHSDIGRTIKTGTFQTREFAGNGLNGVAIINGAHDNWIGDMHTDNRVHIDANAQAGILIDNSDSNHVLGCYIGKSIEAVTLTENDKNRVGIHIRNGSQGNIIGGIGPMIGRDPNFLSRTGIVDRLNQISNSKEIGIHIEDSGGTLDSAMDRIDPNVIQNNSIYSDDTGLKISGFSEVNDIGGWRGGGYGYDYYTEENNSIQGNKYGIVFDNVQTWFPERRNRFLNNGISSNINPLGIDLDAGPSVGTGVLITNGSKGIIFGESLKAPNFFQRNNVGIYINNCDYNIVRGNEIGSVWAFNSLAGVFINDGDSNDIGQYDQPGRGNLITYNGKSGSWGDETPTTNPNGGGVVISGGRDNVIANNKIQDNGGNGVFLNYTEDNIIGGAENASRNVITSNSENGIAIAGTSTDNTIQSNLIGIDELWEEKGNEKDGIDISSGASNNLIGGKGPVYHNNSGSTSNSSTIMPGPNTIAFNNSNGIHVTGSTSVGNSILGNSIFKNIGQGILNQSMGNSELPPPINMLYGKQAITGEVSQTIPPGSFVNVFSDTGNQGEVLIGTTEVRNGWTWQIGGLLPAAFPNITATVTHINSGSTSMFATASEETPRGFNIIRSDGNVPGQQTVNYGSGLINVLKLKVIASGDRVKVKTLTFTAEGTLADNADIDEVIIYRDNNLDGIITESDLKISDAPTFTVNNGTVILKLNNAIIDPDYPEEWIILYKTSHTVPNGQTYSLEIKSGNDVKADFLFPIGVNAVPVGPFPVRSDEFTTSGG